MQSVSITTNVGVRIPLRRGVLNTTLCDKVCQYLVTGWWFSLGTPVLKDHHDITEILLKVALNTITLSLIPKWWLKFHIYWSYYLYNECLLLRFPKENLPGGSIHTKQIYFRGNVCSVKSKHMACCQQRQTSHCNRNV